MNFIIAVIAMLLDRIIGDPRSLPHPVIWIGNTISFFEKRCNQGNARYIKGLITSSIIVLVVGIVVFAIVQVSSMLSFWLGIIVEIILITIAIAQKSLKQAAIVVYDALRQGDMTEARTKLGWIVGRDTAHLEEQEIVRGVVETVSENTSDGVTAPLFYALLFGATGAWVYKAINTLDSMIGYKNERYKDYGRFAAKLDDVVNFLPSRITGLLIVLFTKNEGPFSLKERFTYWLQDAKKHPSPNSGYLEAATAYQLGIRLGGENVYGGVTSFRAYMGQPIVALQKQHIVQSVQHMYRISIIFTIIIGGIQYAISSTWS
ncbi:adenosylcobinamide-phosphate synthase CbiB [Solibacillus sp. CAU 1738]|uniref:adenosylcobinamide-phosphate synthase CbiB n=1 Tax=Solibacillus sp. CAU 1738 TaxID=3140363 RepID=UPI0032615E2C